MKLRIVVALLTAVGRLAGSPAWAFWGGKDSLDDPIDALVTIEALPLYAEVRLNGALVGTALEIANQGLAVFGSRAYIVNITAPGHIAAHADAGREQRDAPARPRRPGPHPHALTAADQSFGRRGQRLLACAPRAAPSSRPSRSSPSVRSSRTASSTGTTPSISSITRTTAGLGPAQLQWMATTVHMGHWIPVTWLTLGSRLRALGDGPAWLPPDEPPLPHCDRAGRSTRSPPASRAGAAARHAADSTSRWAPPRPPCSSRCIRFGSNRSRGRPSAATWSPGSSSC